MTTYLHASHFHHNRLLLKILSKPLLAAALMIGCFLLLSEHSYANTQSSLLIRNVYIISADTSLSEKPLNVLIKEGRISAIGAEEFSADSVIDGGGQYLIPGLIDTHVHLGGVPGFTGDEQSDLYQQAMAQIPKSYLYSGFTTLLDLVTTREAIAQWNSQAIAPQAFFLRTCAYPKGLSDCISARGNSTHRRFRTLLFTRQIPHTYRHTGP